MSGSVAAIPGVTATPSVAKTVLASNYINTFDFNTQYLPETDQQEFNRYGNQSITGFLDAMGAEKPFSSDKLIWSENGRLHISYKNIAISYGAGNDTATCTVSDPGVTQCNFRKNQTILLSSTSATSNTKDHAMVTATNVGGNPLVFTVAYYTAGGGTIAATDVATAFVYGSEFRKGVVGMDESLEVTPNIYEIDPVIIKDYYEISGSDMAQIGWITAAEEGKSDGNYWYLKSKSETMKRFNDYLEIMLIEHRVAEAGSGVAALPSPFGNKGTKGMFSAIEEDGNVWSGGYPTSLGEFDSAIQRMDKQGNISENCLFINLNFSTAIDDMLASQSSVAAGGVSYGVFDNSEQMALNLGFKGFNRSGYSFYKKRWRYLDDPTLRGGMVGGAVNGVLVPVGTTQVRDTNQGTVDTLPYLHMCYRTAPNADRKMNSWITGGAGGAATSSLDAMQVHFLGERMLRTLGTINFMLFEN